MTDTEKEEQFSARFGRAIVKFRWPVLILSLVLGFALMSGAQHIGFNSDYKAFFSEENPDLAAFEENQRTYTKSDNILFTVLPDGESSAFSQSAIDAIYQLTEEAWYLPYSIRVDSITNFQHTEAIEDDLIVESLVDDPSVLEDTDLERIREVALNEPSLVRQVISEDGRTAGVLVTLQLPGQSIEEMPKVAEAARILIDKIEAEYPVDLRLTGTVALNNAFFESAAKDASTLVPLMYLVIIIVTVLLVRSLSATLGAVIVLIMSVGTALGIAGYLGILLTPPSASSTTIITTLAVADSVHFLMTMMAALRGGASKHDAIVESMRVNLQPIFLTSITTAIGFLSMNFSDAPPFRDLGNITAIGVMAAFIFSIALLPALMAILPVKAKASGSRLDTQIEAFGNFVVRRRKTILTLSVAVSLGLVALIPLNKINDDMISYFDKSLDFRSSTDITLDRLTGIYQVEFSLETGNPNGVSEPAFLEKVSDFTDWLRTQPEVIHVRSISDTFKRLNKNLHGDDAEWYRLPDDREQAAQYLLLYELSLPYGLDLNNQLNIDKSSTRVTVTLQDMNSDELIAVADKTETWLRENTGLDAMGVGPVIMFAHISERNIASMINGTLLAIALISLIIMVALRSVTLGLVSLIPNLLPAGVAFGIWGVFVGEINVAASIVLGMAMGILVDDTVHFLSKYTRARREHNHSTEQAVKFAFHHVGSAILVTSIILVAGFSLLSLSTFALNKYMAQLTAIAVTAALLGVAFLLPTLLMAIDRKNDPARQDA